MAEKMRLLLLSLRSLITGHRPLPSPLPSFYFPRAIGAGNGKQDADQQRSSGPIHVNAMKMLKIVLPSFCRLVYVHQISESSFPYVPKFQKYGGMPVISLDCLPRVPVPPTQV